MQAKWYDNFVYRVPEIRHRYQMYRSKGNGKIKSLLYLLWLNFSCFIFQDRTLRESMVTIPNGKLLNKSSGMFSVELLCKYDVISFDVFDTLLFRTCEAPEDVFEKILPEKENFKELRKTAEQTMRKRLLQTRETTEVTIEEIYHYLEQKHGIAKKLRDKEVEIEQKVCYANQSLHFIVNQLKEYGKRVIITSDMYLGADVIKELLTNAGYEQFDAYYVSCDYRASKFEGELYGIVREKESCYGTTFVHIGDDEVSDVKRALKYGFDAYYYKK